MTPEKCEFCGGTVGDVHDRNCPNIIGLGESKKLSDPKEVNVETGIKHETGENRVFSTGAHKQAAVGKGIPVLIPPDAMFELACHFEDGAILHGPSNWTKGIPLSELINSLERHIWQEKLGMTDERHDRAIAWNAIVYLATKLRINFGILPKELDDIGELINCQTDGDKNV